MKPTFLFSAILVLGLADSVPAQQPPKPAGNDNSAPPVARAEFSADGKRIVTTAPDKGVRVWDAKTGQLLGVQPESAEQLLAHAKAKADTEHKAIFVHFGASWCGWCRKLDVFLESADGKPAFEKYFVPVKLVVQENERNKALENPGAEALLKLWGGPDGLPYSVFLDAQGELIVNSKHNGHNIGYPAQPDELDWFVEMIEKAAPAVSPEELKSIRKALQPVQSSTKAGGP